MTLKLQIIEQVLAVILLGCPNKSYFSDVFQVDFYTKIRFRETAQKHSCKEQLSKFRVIHKVLKSERRAMFHR